MVVDFRVLMRRVISPPWEGGSDTTAVALAQFLMPTCEIYRMWTAYLADPKIVPGARKLRIFPMMRCWSASLGARVLHNRSVELAKKYNVNMVVRSSLNNGNGTWSRGSGSGKMLIKESHMTRILHGYR